MKKRSIECVAAFGFGLFAASASADGVRNYISIVGSTTVQPFSVAVAEQLAKSTKLKAPMIESTGTGGGITLFCEGVGMAYPDIVNASRPMRQSELDRCRANGVNDVVEVKLGLGAVVAIQAGGAPSFDLTRKDLFLALAKRVPDPSCKTPCEKLVINPYQTWKQVNPVLPDQPIQVFGPPASSGTSETFMELAMDAGCDSFPWLAAKKSKNEVEYKRISHAIRDDGVYIEETTESILSRVAGQPKAVGLVSYSGFLNSRDSVQLVTVEGIKPEVRRLVDQTYSLTRPLLFYVKKAHVARVPGLEQFVAEMSSEKAWGPKGYLAKKGLVPMTVGERTGYAQIVRDLKPMAVAGQLLPVLPSIADESQTVPPMPPAKKPVLAKKPTSSKKAGSSKPKGQK